MLERIRLPVNQNSGEGWVRVVVRVKWLIVRRGEGGEGKLFMIDKKYLPNLLFY